MIFNFTLDFQFSTRLYLENNLLDITNQTKLLGTVLTSDMKWHANTETIVKRAYQRMIILHKLYSLNVAISDLVHIYILYIRSILEHSCQVWHYSITEEEISAPIQHFNQYSEQENLNSRNQFVYSVNCLTDSVLLHSGKGAFLGRLINFVPLLSEFRGKRTVQCPQGHNFNF